MNPTELGAVTVARIVKILEEEGCGPGNSIHSFRCTFPPGRDPCDCLEQLAIRIKDEVVLVVAHQIIRALPKEQV